MVITAVERFAQVIPLNLQEIFIWYFEQKGVENPERFLGVNEGVNEGVNWVNNGINREVDPKNKTDYLLDNTNPEIQQKSKEQNNNEQVLLGLLGDLIKKDTSKIPDISEVVRVFKSNKKSKK